MNSGTFQSGTGQQWTWSPAFDSFPAGPWIQTSKQSPFETKVLSLTEQPPVSKMVQMKGLFPDSERVFRGGGGDNALQ